MADPQEVEAVCRALFSWWPKAPNPEGERQRARAAIAALDRVRAERAECPTCGGRGTYVDRENEVRDCATCAERAEGMVKLADVLAWAERLEDENPITLGGWLTSRVKAEFGEASDGR